MRPAPAPRTPALAGPLASLLLLAAALILYRASMNLPLLDTESFRLVVSRPAVQRVESLRHLWTPFCFDAFGEGYHPLSTLLRHWGWTAFGAQPAGYRLVHLLLCFANALWLAAIGARLNGGRGWAWIAAAYYFLRTTPAPLGGLAAGSDALAAFFCLAATWSHLRTCGEKGSLWALPLTAGAYALALLSKESAALLPALLLAHSVFFIPMEEPGARRPVLAEQAVLWGLAGLYLAWLTWGVRAFTPASRLGQTLPPSGLDALLDLLSAWLRFCTPAGTALMSLGALLLLLGGGTDFSRIARWTGFALAWSALALQQDAGGEPGRLALPGAGMALWLAWLGSEMGRRPFTRPLAYAAAGALLLWSLAGAWTAPSRRLLGVPEAVLNETFLASDPGRRSFPESFSAAMLSMPLLVRREPELAARIGATLRESMSLSQSDLIMDYFSDPALLRDPWKARQALQLLGLGDLKELAARLSAERYFLIAKALLEQRDFPAALSAFTESVARDPGHSLACLGIAQTRFAMGDSAGSADQLEACANGSERHPKSPLVVELSPVASAAARAREAAARGRADEALVLYGRMLSAPGLDWGTWRSDTLADRGALLLRLRRYDEAARDYEASLNSSTWLWPGGASASRTLALLKTGAREAYDRGLTAASSGDAKTALAEFSSAVAAFPAYPEALLRRGAALAALKRHEEAVVGFDRALLRESLPPSLAADLLAARGASFLELQRLREARDDLRQALRDAPPDWKGRTAALALLVDPRLSSLRKK